jgi:metal-responsive CopG/Arc/MetJ family transcriptional regulator
MSKKKILQNKSRKVMVSFEPEILKTIDRFAATGFGVSISRSAFLEIAAKHYIETGVQLSSATKLDRR